MAVSFRIHWVRAILSDDDVADELAMLSQRASCVRESRQRFGRDEWSLGPWGSELWYDSARNLPPVFEAQGSVLDQAGGELLGMLDGGIRRLCMLHVAADFPAHEVHPTRGLRGLEAVYRRGRIETKVRSSSCTALRNDNGDTVYFGSQASPFHVAAYNKRGFLRVEFRIADVSDPDAIAAVVAGDAAALWRGLAASKFDASSLRWFRDAMTGRSVAVESDVRDEGSLRSSMRAHMQQWGPAVGFWRLAGVDPSEIGALPTSLTRAQRIKFSKWLDEMREMGLDVTRCREYLDGVRDEDDDAPF